jgi:hypothetical protein
MRRRGDNQQTTVGEGRAEADGQGPEHHRQGGQADAGSLAEGELALASAAVSTGPAGPAVATGPAVTTAGARMSPRKALRLVPWFLIGFVVMAAANSAGLIPATWHGPLSQLSLFLVAMALSAIGLSTDVAALRRAGAKPLLLGAMLWVTVAAASLGLQFLTGSLH